jgi:hypothetical protein
VAKLSSFGNMSPLLTKCVPVIRLSESVFKLISAYWCLYYTEYEVSPNYVCKWKS